MTTSSQDHIASARAQHPAGRPHLRSVAAGPTATTAAPTTVATTTVAPTIVASTPMGTGPTAAVSAPPVPRVHLVGAGPGDPVVFGRGGEETLELAARGVATELVPGISSAIAAPELAGIPVTHRGVSGGFLVLTARRAADEEGTLGPDAEVAARFSGTLIVLMGGSRLGELATELLAHGRAGTTPAAVVANAGRPEQVTVRGTLVDVAARAAQADLGTPAVLVVGEVVEVLAGVAVAAPGRVGVAAAW